jgi:putative ABC transport system substrate-binding protein
VAPDCRLITPTTFAVAKAFGRSNNLPLYVAIDNLVDIGAVAAIAPDFHEMGRTAGRLTAQALAGELGNAASVYPETSYLTLNLKTAKESGLTIPGEVIRMAHRVVR